MLKKIFEHSLRMLRDKFNKDIIVTNCDTLIDVNYKNLGIS